ncbi:MAG: cell division protein FtsZ [Thaumarchaeota archaeon S15]|nr:MAG: cell division protein FtsZ [Thaumarchaeota archaeon S13]RNJ73779.1 MAG: cell division protein FtsZ [Thaumarchaeota archaeon S15]
MTEVSGPIMIVGAGGAGSRLAPEAASRLGAGHVLVSNVASDLRGEASIEVSTAPVINPTVHVIRSAARRGAPQVLGAVGGARTVIVMAGLAGRSGAGIAPMLAEAASAAGKTVISVAIMPFGFEKDRVFGAGIALKRLRAASDCTIIVDNDAMLEGSPGLGAQSCIGMANAAIMHVVGSIGAGDVPGGDSVVAASRAGAGLEESVREAIKMLYEGGVRGTAAQSLVHVIGDDVPVGDIAGAAAAVSGTAGGAATARAAGPGGEGVVVVSELGGASKFDSYDPLGAIPAGMTLDWDEAERSVPCDLDIVQIER